MKYTNKLAIGTFAALTALLLLLMCGCQTQNTAGRLLASTTLAVDATMQGWATYVVTAKPPAVQEDSVKNAYAQYQIAEQIAETAYLEYTKTGEATSWQRASAAMVLCKDNLIRLIAAFQSK